MGLRMGLCMDLCTWSQAGGGRLDGWVIVVAYEQSDSLAFWDYIIRQKTMLSRLYRYFGAGLWPVCDVSFAHLLPSPRRDLV